MKYKRRKAAKQKLSNLLENGESILFVHYSCESFMDRDQGSTPRITSIAIRHYNSGQTHSFSIHKIAEINKIESIDIQDAYDDLEKQMLTEYYEFIKSHKGYKWVHWNMRDINYGFPAIDHRYRVLGGSPVIIDENYKFDLAKLLIDIYTPNYTKHQRMQDLIELNNISKRMFLSGAEEAESFEKQEFVKLHQSTLRKVDILPTILEKYIDGTLKTRARIWHIYSPKDIGIFIKEHWVIASFTFVLTITGFIISLFK